MIINCQSCYDAKILCPKNKPEETYPCQDCGRLLDDAFRPTNCCHCGDCRCYNRNI